MARLSKGKEGERSADLGERQFGFVSVFGVVQADADHSGRSRDGREILTKG
jgi:hypothetical protein